MITVERRILSEQEAVAKLAALAARYRIQTDCYEKSAADQMSDFDAQKWLSLCDQVKAAKRRRYENRADCGVPSGLRSIYGGVKVPFRSEEPENTSDTLIKLAA